jgi:hypothetical protein
MFWSIDWNIWLLVTNYISLYAVKILARHQGYTSEPAATGRLLKQKGTQGGN